MTGDINLRTGRRVLVVDDAHEICELIKVHYKAKGVEVVCAYDGHTGLLFYHMGIVNSEAVPKSFRTDFNNFRALAHLDHPFDVILMDVALPGLNGGTVVDNIRNLEKQSTLIKKRAYIIGFSAYDERMRDTELKETVDFDDYLAKPDSKGELLNLLDKALGVVA